VKTETELIAEMAAAVLGTRSAAERWLSAPAIALDQRKPVDLLVSVEGRALVRTLLVRMDYGVYC
jgi:putative toxin-antitoxin system antitoxin component (TIGR02293 family)